MKRILATLALALLISVALYNKLEAIGRELCTEPNIECAGVTKIEDSHLVLPADCKVDGLVWQGGTPCNTLQVVVDDGTGDQLDTFNPQQAGKND